MIILTGVNDPPFCLRYLLEYPPPEGDRDARICETIRSVRVDWAGSNQTGPHTLLQIAVDPPFMMMGTLVSEMMSGEYYPGSGLILPKGRFCPAMIYRVRDWNGVSRRKVDAKSLHKWHAADIARALEYLPPTREEAFEEALEHMRRFAAREGHSDVPEMHVEGSYNLGIWVQNARRGGLNLEEATRLAAIPEWRWLSPEELGLLEAYAERQGHTDPPDTYVVDRLALENLVSQVRRQHRNGLVSPEEARRLEQVPYWHW